MAITKFNLSDHYRGNLTWLPERTIFLTRHGSQAYGTSTPTSDLDVKGICVPPKEYILGFTKTFEQTEIKGDPDVVVYDIRKFFKLASDCNPNIIEVLFTSPEDWFLTTPVFEKLYAYRHLFLSKKARHTFSGYAMSQLKRIHTHKRWLLNPPTHKPGREEYGLSDQHKVVTRDEMGALDKLVEEGYTVDEHAMRVLQKEKLYQNALLEWTQYETWKKTRNEKRSATEAKFGYDTKHAMHLVRLLRMCREILAEGVVHVRRSDAEELIAIRNGAWSYENLMAWAEEQDSKLEELYITSKLPHASDRDRLDVLCMEIIESML